MKSRFKYIYIIKFSEKEKKKEKKFLTGRRVDRDKGPGYTKNTPVEDFVLNLLEI